MTMTNTMLVISEAISKGAKPLFTEEGQKLIADYIAGKSIPAPKGWEVAN